MNLNEQIWHNFKINKLFSVEAGKYYYADEYTDGNTPYCSASAENNGVGKYIDLPADFDGNKIIAGKVGCTAFYQPNPFCATSDVNVLSPLFKMSEQVGIFITTIINKNENYRWNYGRQCRVGNTKNIVIKLPVQVDDSKRPLLDETKKFSDEGHIPNWGWIEDYIKTLNYKRVSTSIRSQYQDMNLSEWKSFRLADLFDIYRGNGLSRVALDDGTDNGINFISRQSYNNGINSIVEQLENVKPFSNGCITVALGGEYLGSSFVQLRPFYTGAHMAVLISKDTKMTLFSKLFICTLIRFEAKVKYCAFGRELDTHIDREFAVKLPVKKDENGIVIDKEYIFSDKGYIPDWQWIENYIKSLPYCDKI